MKSPGKIAFIGIGGAGMTPLAQYFLSQNWEVSGYDRVLSDNCKKLQELGASIEIAEHWEWSPSYENLNHVVYSAAFKSNHPCLVAFQKRGIKTQKRAEVLGEISKLHACIAVAGTHGKTTTSAILSKILDTHTGVLAFVGGKVADFGGNYRNTGGDFMVAEADEFDRSLMHLDPHGVILTSLEADHLDVYADFADLERTMLSFCNRTPLRVVHESNPAIFHKQALVYGVQESSDYVVKNVKVSGLETRWEVWTSEGKWLTINWNFLGEHNRFNALASMIMAKQLGVPDATIVQAVESFQGVWRRFQIYPTKAGLLIDDYAHHPSEIDAVAHTLKQAFPEKKCLAIFQPHLFSRTRDFMNDFARSLDGFEATWVLPIYPAREEPIEGVTSTVLVEKAGEMVQEIQPKEIIPQFKEHGNAYDLVVLLGASDLHQFINPLKQVMNEMA